MPFSKLPKARALQRLVDQKEQEIDGLRNALNKVQEGQNNTDNTDDMAAPIALSTPQREAVQLCDSMNVTPTAPRIRAVLPLTAAVDAVKNAPTDIKKKLFSGRKSRKVNRIASAVSKKIKLSRNLVHSEHSAKTMRLSLAKSKIGLVWFRGLTPQQQPGSYQGGEMMMKSVFWWRKPEHPEETTDLRQVTDETFSHIRPLPSPGIELGPQRCEAKGAKAQ